MHKFTINSITEIFSSKLLRIQPAYRSMKIQSMKKINNIKVENYTGISPELLPITLKKEMAFPLWVYKFNTLIKLFSPKSSTFKELF